MQIVREPGGSVQQAVEGFRADGHVTGKSCDFAGRAVLAL